MSGIVVAAISGVRLMELDLSVSPTTFELLRVLVAVGSSWFVAVIVYRPGFAVISAAFFVKIDLLDTFAEPAQRLERSTDSDTGRFVDMPTARGLARIITDPTHRLTGRLISLRRASTSCRRGSTLSTFNICINYIVMPSIVTIVFVRYYPTYFGFGLCNSVV